MAADTIVLCEDETQWLFIYRWLLKRGVARQSVRLVPLPAGRGAGTKHVLSHVATEVTEHRRKAGHQRSRRLVVAIDADTSTVAARLIQLEHEVAPPRGPTERVCFVIPRRNVETWLHFFHGKPTDETTDYKLLYDGDAKSRACKIAGEAFEAWLQAAPPPKAVASVESSRAEAGRI